MPGACKRRATPPGGMHRRSDGKLVSVRGLRSRRKLGRIGGVHQMPQAVLVTLVSLVATVACAEERRVTEERSLTVDASAYNSTAAQTVGDPNEGAWGDEITPGMQIIAVSPDLVEAGLGRGTEVEIEGLSGTWTVLDRTASRHRNRIDIYMGVDVEAAREWGIREVVVRWVD